MKSGLTLWDELCQRFYSAAHNVTMMQEKWNSLKGLIDEERYYQVEQLLAIQEKEAIWWRNSMLLYFQQFSKQPIPAKFEQPDKTLKYYMNLKFHYVPGI
jgi:alpha-glucuronidase